MNKYLEKISAISFNSNIPDDLLSKAKSDSEIGPWLNDPSKYQSILFNDVPVGTIRVDRSAGTNKIGSIFIDPDHRGRGYASEAVREAVGIKHGRALISPDNLPSQALFRSQGFSKIRSSNFDGEVLDVWERPRSK